MRRLLVWLWRLALRRLQSPHIEQLECSVGHEPQTTLEGDTGVKKNPKIAHQVVIEEGRVINNLLYGDKTRVVEYQNETTVPEFMAYCAHSLEGYEPRSLGITPNGMIVRDIYQRGNLMVFLVELAPGPRTMQWIRDDSPTEYGADSTYRDITVALPWQYFFVTMDTDGSLHDKQSVFFRNEPLRSLTDPLCDCHFYNCSIKSYNIYCWICVQTYDTYARAGCSFMERANEFVEWFWYSGFNRSSEHNEGKSFWGENRKKIKDRRVQTIAAWETATKDNSRFALSVPWIDSGYTPQEVYAELTADARVWQPTSSDDIAHILKKCGAKDNR